MFLQHVYFFLFLRVAPRLARGGEIAVIPCSECHCEGIIVQRRGKGGEMAPSLRSKSIVASTRRRLFEHSDCSRVGFGTGGVHVRPVRASDRTGIIF